MSPFIKANEIFCKNRAQKEKGIYIYIEFPGW